MKKNIKEIFQSGLFITIGGYSIDFPIGEKWGSIDDVLANIIDIINMLITLSAVVAVVMIIVGGYTFMTAGGDPDKTEQGQKTLTNALIGLAVVAIVRLIIQLVLDVFI